MGARICKVLDSSACLFPCMTLIVLGVSGFSRGPETCVEWCSHVPLEEQNQTLTESGPQTSNDPQVKAVLDKTAAAGIARPATVQDVRKAYLFYPKLSGIPEHLFRIEDRQIPGPRKNIPARVYTPSSKKNGLPILVCFHGGGFVGQP